MGNLKRVIERAQKYYQTPEREQELETKKLISLSKVSTDADLYRLLDRVDEETAEAEQLLGLQDDAQLTIGPYTVFASCKAPEITLGSQTFEQTEFVDWSLSDSSPEYLDNRNFEIIDSMHNRMIHDGQDKLDYPGYTAHPDPSHTDFFIGPSEHIEDSYALISHLDPCLACADIDCPLSVQLGIHHKHTESLPRALSPPLHTKSPYMPKNVKYLLAHYGTVVIDSLSAIPLPEQRAPWRGLHLSCAMAATGELDVFGTTSLAKISLLYSLLALTCFHLSSMYKVDVQTSTIGFSEPVTESIPSTQYWKEQAEKFRAISRTAFRKHLKNMIANPSHKQKYKESLMSAMSLVCVGIVSGDVWDSRMYIMQCEDIIRKIGSSKARMSKKALQLHRLFAFISIVERTTFCLSGSHYGGLLETKNSRAITSGLSKEVMESHDDLTLEASCIGQTRLQLSELRLEMSNDDGFESLCGIPGKLFELLADTNTLIEKIEQQPSDYRIPSGLLDEASKMEDLICNYESELTPSTPELGRLMTANTRSFLTLEEKRQDASAVMSTCMRDAMYNALLVYFFREVRNTNAKIIQHYVHKVLICLEAHQQIKIQEFPSERIGIIVWPAFIIACEALGLDLRQRALACIRHADRSGFRNGEIAETVVHEVWRQRDAGNSNISWREIVRKSRLPMLLT